MLQVVTSAAFNKFFDAFKITIVEFKLNILRKLEIEFAGV